MTTVTLTNSSTDNATRYLIWNLNLEIGEDGKNIAGSFPGFMEEGPQLAAILSQVHQGMATGTPPAGAVIQSKQIKFTTSALSNATETTVATFDFKGANLDKRDGTSSVSGVTLSFDQTSYSSTDKTAANVSKTSVGKLALDASYAPSTLSNDVTTDVTTDGSIRFTKFSISSKGTKVNSDGGTRDTLDRTSSTAMTGDFTGNEDGTGSGSVKTYANTYTESGSASAQSEKISLTSSAGVAFNATTLVSGEFDKLSLQTTYTDKVNPALSSGATIAMNGAVTGFTATLGDYVEGGATVAQLAAALFADADTITAKSGPCTLDGYGGNDVLVGGKGADVFAFSTALGAGNVDTVKNFKKAGADKIALDDAIFTALGGGVTTGNFVSGTAALDADDRVVFDGKTGKLYYDADGSGAAAAVQFATLVGKVSLSASDFTMI